MTHYNYQVNRLRRKTHTIATFIMFIEHYNSQLNRVIQSTNYQFSTMKYINSILKHHKTRKMKSDLKEKERRQLGQV